MISAKTWNDLVGKVRGCRLYPGPGINGKKRLAQRRKARQEKML